MKYFSVPADFKNTTIDSFYKLNNLYENSKVIETYGQVTVGTVLNSGRVTSILPKIDFSNLEKYVQYSKKKNIEFSYTLNASCNGNYEFSRKGQKEIMCLIENLANIGIEKITVTSPAIIELINCIKYNFKIKASAICEIMSPDKALFYKELGVERVVIDPDITRNFEKIKNICKVFGDGVEIIVNNVCYKNCAYKMFHYNHESHCTSTNTTQEIKDYFFNRCSMQKAADFKNLMRLNWIRPEDLRYYQNVGIKHFKLQGRQNVLDGNIVKTVEKYFDESFDGNLFDLITLFSPYNSFQPYIENKKLEGFVKTFHDNPNYCKDVCSKCNYCSMYAEKSMDKKKTIEINEKALNFYKNYDKFKKAINDEYNELKCQEIKKKVEFKDFNIKFDFED